MAASVQPRPENDLEEAEKLRTAYEGVVKELLEEATKREQKRSTVEHRWLDDLAYFHGRYDSRSQSRSEDPLQQEDDRAKAAGRSRIFLNRTRQKTVGMAARLEDMLFPTDDKNWAIRPTPLPRMSKAAEEAMDQLFDTQARLQQADDEAQALQPAEGEEPSPVFLQQEEQVNQLAQQREDEMAEVERLQAIIAEARKRAEAMERVIDDQLVESDYQAQCRDVIMDACKLGTGVLKGPVKDAKPVKRWAQKRGHDGRMVSVLEEQASDNPTFRRVDPWSFFPSSDARTLDESEGTFERHLMNPMRMRRLALRPGFNKAMIREVLQLQKEGANIPDYLSDLRALGEETESVEGPLFKVWEYNGPLAAEKLATLYQAMGDEDGMAEAFEVDPLDEINVHIWFCGVTPFKVAPYWMDSGEPIYSVFTFEENEASIWGYGVPQIMRHPQRALNSAWRMLLDHASISAGPQTIVNKELLEPEDGTWSLRAFKIWLRKKIGMQNEAPPFEVVEIKSNIAELISIIEIADKVIDETTGLPPMAEGEPGVQPRQTATGLTLQAASANVQFRRVVRRFDDDLTKPTLRRAYDWNMQFGEDESIKGDYEVEPRGASALLSREMQAENIALIVDKYGNSLVFGGILKAAPAFREVLKAFNIAPATIAKTDQELQEEADNAQDPEAEEREWFRKHEERKLEVEVAKAEMETDSREYVAEMGVHRAMIQTETVADVQLEKIRQQIADRQKDREQKDKDREQKDRNMAIEVAMAEETGVSSGGAV